MNVIFLHGFFEEISEVAVVWFLIELEVFAVIEILGKFWWEASAEHFRGSLEFFFHDAFVFVL